jgi:hypothetical protein
MLSVFEWKFMSRLVRRLARAARVVVGVRSSWRVDSGFIWGAVKRIELHFESRRAVERFVIALVQAGDQSRWIVNWGLC